MLKQGSVAQIRNGEISRGDSHIVVAMCFYPRGMRKDLIDEYRSDLAPDRELFSEWKEFEKKSGHDEAFRLSHYETRFSLKPAALLHLQNLSELPRDVVLVCQCGVGERCHREMLLLTAQRKYGAKVDKVFHSYPEYEKRIEGLSDKLW